MKRKKNTWLCVYELRGELFVCYIPAYSSFSAALTVRKIFAGHPVVLLKQPAKVLPKNEVQSFEKIFPNKYNY